jgi:hypothetical protein
MVDGDHGMEHPQNGRIEIMAKPVRAFYRFLSNRAASTPMRIRSIDVRASMPYLNFGARHEKKRFREALRTRLRTTGNCRCSDEQENGNFNSTEARFFAIEHHQSDRLLVGCDRNLSWK